MSPSVPCPIPFLSFLILKLVVVDSSSFLVSSSAVAAGLNTLYRAEVLLATAGDYVYIRVEPRVSAEV
jgi:hypothetical protein